MSRPQKRGTTTRRHGVSRRSFIRGVSLGTGALQAGLFPLTLDAAQSAAKVVGPGPVEVTLWVNGKQHTIKVEPRVTLLDALRDRLGIVGPKRSCDRGTCGSCTVLLDGKAVYACSILAIDAAGKNIQTPEILGEGSEPDVVARAFVNQDAMQCGYCTPGFAIAVKAFLEKYPNPTDELIKEELSGNLCRCGTYVGIRRAIYEAAKHMGGRNG